MFTGIIQEKGTVVRISKTGHVRALELKSSVISKGVNIGDSVAVNGVCLTVTGKVNGIMNFDVMDETISKTNLKNIKAGEPVNLEPSLRAGDTISGHFVYGHIDGMRKILSINDSRGGLYIDIKPERGDDRNIVEKGSIAIDGISLTIGRVYSGKLRMYIIPHTLESTTLYDRKAGDYVNVEFDMLAKYAGSQKRVTRSKITKRFLEDSGFM